MSRPRERRETGEQDLFRSRLDQIINMTHELVRLAQAIDWPLLERRFGAVYSDGPGMPPLPTRLMAGLSILKHTFNLSGEERLSALLQESLAVADKTGAMKPQDTRQVTRQVIIDTTVQPKNVMFPTDAKLLHRARERLVRLAKKTGVTLRQTYVRVGKLALIKHQRYARAKQFKRANKALRTLKTYLGRTVRDIARQIGKDETLRSVLLWPLYQVSTVLEQRQRQRGRKIYSLHAPEVECIGKGKAHRPYEFGVKVSVATTLKRSKGGQFALHAKALPGNPYDDHTLATAIPDIENTIGNEIGRILADAGYRGHNAPESHQFRVFTSGQMRRRAAIEPVIGHIKAEHRMDRNYLAHQQGDAINAVLAAAGYNFSLLVNWFSQLLWLLLAWLHTRPTASTA
jgi:IS5 family transposase